MKLILKNILLILFGSVVLFGYIYILKINGLDSIFDIYKTNGRGNTSMIIFGVLGIVFIFLGIRNLIRRE